MVEQQNQRQHGSRRVIVGAAVALGCAVVLAVGGIVIRAGNETALARQTDAAAVTNVDVIAPGPVRQKQTLLLPGDVEAWFQAPIYAQVTGYLRMWYKDIGAVVKAGDLLAEIDTPELDEQYQEASANLAEAEANQRLTEVTAKRWKELLPTQAVAQQSVDVTRLDNVAKQHAVAAAQANLARLAAMEAFKRLIVPFDGVVVARRTDIGALITANSTPGPELFAVADIHAMRVYVRVPQAYVAQVYIGMQAELHLPEYPDRVYPAHVITTAHAINPESRTLLVELMAPNPRGELSPGSFANVNFVLTAAAGTLLLPTSALIFQEHGMQVAVVDANSKVVLKPITIGRDLGTEIEVVTGVVRADAVIDDPPDSITQGLKVRIVSRHGAAPGGADAQQASEPAQ